MSNFNVAEKITAQNSQRNQSKVVEYFNTFSDDQINQIGKMLGRDTTEQNENGSFKLTVTPSFIINYLKKADYCLRKARMSEPDKALINGVIQLLSSFIPFTKKEEYWNHTAESHYPSELEADIQYVGKDECGEFASLEEIGNAAIEEISFILDDFQDENVTYCNPEDAIDVIQEYVDVINECEVEVPDWLISDIQNVMGDC